MTSYSRTDDRGEKLIVAPAAKLKARRGPKFVESRSRIRGHNFAIRLLQTLEGRMHNIVEDFCVGEGVRKQHSTLDRPTFVAKMLAHVRAGTSDPGERSWLAGMSECELKSNLGEVFDAADTQEKGRISFSVLMSYIIDCARYGDVGTVQEAIPEYIGSQGTFFRNLEEITRAKYCPELGKVMAAGKSIGVVNVANLHVQAFAPYPHMMSAADKFATTYDVDYVPHMEALVYVGTDLFIDFASLRGESLMRIPTAKTFSLCSYDRSTKLLLVSRDERIEPLRLQEYRHVDQKYSPCHPLTFHTGGINCILPLQRGGLLATASADKTVVISDLEAGELITTFRAHTNSVHSVDYIEHLNLMMSTAYDTEPKVWMLASSAMRSEAFTLRDVENPHTGVVVSTCHITDTPQVCTLDSHGTAKLWDIRMFRCQQSIRLEKTMEGIFDPRSLKWHSVVWDPDAQELFACAQRRAQKLKRKVLVKEDSAAKAASPAKASSLFGLSPEKKDRGPPPPVAKGASMADEQPILEMVYEPVSQTILTLAEKKVRIWDVFSGHQEAMFDKVVPYETTACSVCISSTGKLFFLGCRNGRLTSHQYSSGVLLSVYLEEGPEISNLCYCAGASAFCATTWRGCRIFTDYQDDRSSFFPDSIHGAEVKFAAHDPLTNIVCTVERRGCVSLWESRSGVYTVTSVKHCGSIHVGHVEVTAVLILTGHPVVAVSTHVGGLLLFTCTPHPMPNKKFAESLFKGREITRLEFYPPKNILYGGDDQGWIHAFDVSAALENVRCQAPSRSWAQIVSTTGRVGVAPRDVLVLRSSHQVHAHMDAVGSLVWAVGCNILVSSSIDQRVLFWTLSLDFIGELDPLSEAGRFTIPLVTPPANFDYVAVPAPLESILFGSALENAEGPLGGSDGAGGEGGAGQTLTASKFAEDVHKIAVALESFVPTESPARKDNKVLAKTMVQLGIESSPASKTYGKRALLQTRSSSRRSDDKMNPSAADGGDADAGHRVFSPNSSGVDCHSLFSPAPRSTSVRPKLHTVDQVTAEDVATRGGVPMVVTRNFPLHPNAKHDRDWLIKEMMVQEAAEDEVRVAARGHEPQSTLKQQPAQIGRGVGDLVDVAQSRSSHHQHHQLATTHDSRAEGSLSLAADIPSSRVKSWSNMSSRPATPQEVVGEEFFSNGTNFVALGNPETETAGAAPLRSSLPKLFKTLLPCELLQLRREIARSRVQQRRQGLTPTNLTPNDIRMSNTRDGKRIFEVTLSATHSPPTSPAAMPSWDGDLDWQRSPVLGATNGTDARLGARSVPRDGPPHLYDNSFRRGFIVGDVPSVGYGTLGVRSLTPLMVSSTSLKSNSWPKSHRVELDDPLGAGYSPLSTLQRSTVSSQGQTVPQLQGIPSADEHRSPPLQRHGGSTRPPRPAPTTL